MVYELRGAAMWGACRYCIQPPGDGPSRHATMDCLAADTMPVFFDEHLTAVMPFSDIIDFADFTECALPPPAAFPHLFRP